jgi:ribosome-associated protein
MANPPDSNGLARLAFDAMADKQVADLVILDIRPVSLLTDLFVIGTAESERQLHAVVDAVTESLRQQAGVKPLHIEGQADSGWVLIDYGDVVVHVFDPERRRFYALESMWDQAPLVARMA